MDDWRGGRMATFLPARTRKAAMPSSLTEGTSSTVSIHVVRAQMADKLP
jgi:hypothetical protein